MKRGDVENEFPGNSRRERTAPQSETKDESKNIEVVVTSEVVRRKRPVGKRFLETFLGGSAREVARYVALDVLLPAAKDMVTDAISQGVERLVYGETRSVGRRTGYRPTTTGPSHVSYNARYSPGSGPLPARRDETRTISARAKREHDLEEIVIQTRPEAEMVLRRLTDLAERYPSVSLGDLYGFLGITPNWTDEKWGWTDLSEARIMRVHGGYSLDLPKTEPLS